LKPQSKRESSHPLLDEAAFQQLLSAAYVMQEHNNRLKKAAAPKPVAEVAAQAKPQVSTPPPAQPIPFPVAQQQTSTTAPCRECGLPLAPQEFFCENCGAPAVRSGGAMQKSWASLWEMHHTSDEDVPEEVPVSFANKTLANKTDIEDNDEAQEEIDLFPAELEEIVGKFPAPKIAEEAETETSEPELTNKGLSLVATDASTESNPAAAGPQTPSTWTSAAKARAWLDSLKAQQPGADWFREEWKFHRGTIAIALASAVLLVVIFQWATQPVASAGQTGRLSGFEQMLVSLGLAEAPAPPALPSPGNPNTKVWVDVHTALYYCPGADLYGKTTDGRVTSQEDAQRDHFQPSTLKACD